jgi:Tfp pilus assembly protein PilV
MMKIRRRRQAGFSMLEILMTTFLIMIGLLVVMTSFVAIAKSHKYSERMDVAASLARLEMEKLRNRSYDNIRSETGAYHEYPEHPDYRHEIEVTDRATAKEVTLRILFENDRRRAELKTYVTNM